MRDKIVHSNQRAEDPDERRRAAAQKALLSNPAVDQVAPVAVPAAELAPSRGGGHARVIALLGGAQATLLVAGMARLKLIALLLGPAGMGVAGVIDLTAQLTLQIGALNIPTAALRFLAIAEQERGTQGFAWLYRTFLRITISSTALVAALVAVGFLLWPHVTTEIGGFHVALLLSLAAVPLTGATNLIRNVLATLRRHRVAAQSLLASSAILVGSTYVGLRLGGLGGAYLAALLVALATVATLHTLVRPSLRSVPVHRGGSLLALLKEHPDIVRFSATLYAVGFAIPLSYWIVRWTVLQRLGQEEAGFLTAAYAIASGLRTVFGQASTQYLIPLVSRDAPRDVRATESARYIRTLLFLLLAGALPLLLFPYELLLVLSSRAFLPAVVVVGAFILSEAVNVIGDAYRVLQLGLNDLHGYFVTTCGGAVMVAAFITWVVPRYGLAGAAVLQVGAALIVLAWSIGRLRSRHDIHVGWRSFALTAYVTVALALAVAVGRVAYRPQPATIAAKLLMGIVLVVIALALVPREERRAMLRPLERGR